jgi:hypothetical protein
VKQTLQKHLELFVANSNFLRNKLPTQYGIQDDPQKDDLSGVMRAADLRLKYLLTACYRRAMRTRHPENIRTWLSKNTSLAATICPLVTGVLIGRNPPPPG